MSYLCYPRTIWRQTFLRIPSTGNKILNHTKVANTSHLQAESKKMGKTAYRFQLIDCAFRSYQVPNVQHFWIPLATFFNTDKPKRCQGSWPLMCIIKDSPHHLWYAVFRSHCNNASFFRQTVKIRAFLIIFGGFRSCYSKLERLWYVITSFRATRRGIITVNVCASGTNSHSMKRTGLPQWKLHLHWWLKSKTLLENGACIYSRYDCRRLAICMFLRTKINKRARLSRLYSPRRRSQNLGINSWCIRNKVVGWLEGPRYTQTRPSLVLFDGFTKCQWMLYGVQRVETENSWLWGSTIGKWVTHVEHDCWWRPVDKSALWNSQKSNFQSNRR